jgi:hypothetical protein
MHSSTHASHPYKRIFAIALGLVGVALCAWSIGDKIRIQTYARKLSSPERRVRERALNVIGGERDVRAAAAVYALLEGETDRDLLEKTGHAAMRLRDVRAVPFLRKRTEGGPDDVVRAKLCMYAARSSNRDCRLVDWLRTGTASAEQWLRAGSALALLELGYVEGGESLIKMAPELAPDVRDWAFLQFREFANAMAQTAGHRIEGWDQEKSPPPTESQISQYDTFWRQYASAQLLSDALFRRERLDDSWRGVNRLIHAQQRVSEWFN